MTWKTARAERRMHCSIGCSPRRFTTAAMAKKPSLGGTTTFVFNEDTQEIEYEYLSLAGTIRNCAGGPTPWNSWLTCEETFESKEAGGNEQNHGYVFEVPASATAMLAEPVPLKAMGRFNHEAVAV